LVKVELMLLWCSSVMEEFVADLRSLAKKLSG